LRRSGMKILKINQNLFLRKSEDLKMGKIRGVRAE
jgi:hypothetical protein